MAEEGRAQGCAVVDRWQGDSSPKTDVGNHKRSLVREKQKYSYGSALPGGVKKVTFFTPPFSTKSTVTDEIKTHFLRHVLIYKGKYYIIIGNNMKIKIIQA